MCRCSFLKPLKISKRLVYWLKVRKFFKVQTLTNKKKLCHICFTIINRSVPNNFMFERPYQAQIRTSYWSTLTLIENDVVSPLQSSYIQKYSQKHHKISTLWLNFKITSLVAQNTDSWDNNNIIVIVLL